MKNVLFVIDTLETGGAEKSILEIASRLQYFKPVVCHVYAGNTLTKEYEKHDIRVVSLNISGRYSFSAAVSALQKVIDEVKPVIVHSTLFRSDIICRRLRKTNTFLLVNSLVNNSYHASRFQQAGLLMKVKLFALRALDANTARRADLFISNSETIKSSNAKALGIPLTKIMVIYRGRSIDTFNAYTVQSGDALRKELGLANKKVLLNVSRLLQRKGQLDLIMALPRVVREHPDVVVLIAGEGPFRPALEQAIIQHNLKDIVILLGNRKDVPALLKMADVFVFPSHYEGLPGALIEAMLAQTPIIASDIGENLECVQMDSASIFPCGNVAALATAIQSTLTNPEVGEGRAQRAYAVAREKFDIAAIVSQYEAAYHNLLSS